ncbi:MAG TPA: glycosyltransferase family 1 protein [Actinomycetota bacterium]|nr:glycosyltransferase family 1 protein [Actinomycetota bacterium]
MSSPLRVGLLASALDGGGGMGRFTRELIGSLGRRTEIELIPVVPPEARATLDALAVPNAREVITIRGRGQVDRALWERFRLGELLGRAGVDVIHGTKHLLPRTQLPTVLTVHDVMAITSPQQYALAKRLLLPRFFRAALRSADVLVAVSESTASRLDRLDPAFGSKTVVAQNGVSIDLMSVAPVEPRATPDGPFALVVGDLSPRKNVSFLADIWDRVAAATNGMKLVAVGPDGWRGSATLRALERAADRGQAIWAGRVGDAELRWYYEHATVVLAPSVEEGFGLPVAEALAFGVPVIASDDPALKEVAQGRAVHLSPRDASAWIEAIASAAKGGTPRPTPPTFPSWQEHAARTVDAYRQAIESRKR